LIEGGVDGAGFPLHKGLTAIAPRFEVTRNRLLVGALAVVTTRPVLNGVHSRRLGEQTSQDQVSVSGFVCELAIIKPRPLDFRFAETVAVSAPAGVTPNVAMPRAIPAPHLRTPRTTLLIQ
jgi:hypothetical protein